MVCKFSIKSISISDILTSGENAAIWQILLRIIRDDHVYIHCKEATATDMKLLYVKCPHSISTDWQQCHINLHIYNNYYYHIW